MARSMASPIVVTGVLLLVASGATFVRNLSIALWRIRFCFLGRVAVNTEGDCAASGCMGSSVGSALGASLGAPLCGSNLLPWHNVGKSKFLCELNKESVAIDGVDMPFFTICMGVDNVGNSDVKW